MALLSDVPRLADEEIDIPLEFDEGGHAAEPVLVPIDQACAHLPLDARLRLFLQLTAAVAESHRHLRLQPGLDPRHVWVSMPAPQTRHDRGRLWGPRPGAAGAAGALGQVRLTGRCDATTSPAPPFASPEQQRGETVGVASDIYSLGALLQVVCNGPLPPASAVDPHGPTTREPLPGDLEPILCKAMAPVPGQRYGSVDALAADLRRCLAGQPVSVRPPSARYLATRFVQRHRLPVLLAGAALAALLAGLVASAGQAERASQARERAEARLQAIRSLTRDAVLGYGEAVNFLPGNLAAKEGLLNGLRSQLDALEREGGDDPAWLSLLTGARARLAQVQANDTGSTLDRLPEARRNAQHAVALGDRAWVARQHDPQFVAAYALALQVRGQSARMVGQAQAGQRDLDEAQRRLEQALSAAPEAERRPLRLQHAAWRLAQAQSLAAPGERQRALLLCDQAEVELRALAAPASTSVGFDPQALPVIALLGSVHAARAAIYSQLGQLDRAREDAAAAVQLRQRALAAQPFNPAWRDALATAASHHAAILLRLDQPVPALQASELAWAQLQGLARDNGPQSPWLGALASVAQQHGRALLANGRPADALPVLAHANALWQATLMREPSEHGRLMLASVQLDQARAKQAGAGRAAPRPTPAAQQPRRAVAASHRTPSGQALRDATASLSPCSTCTDASQSMQASVMLKP